ncbi:Alpha/Beta hydrolase protein [Dendryphion nanum]|uniref:Dipeptidyl-peptidase V n=1 Tax=Dendryphion nanum TaxID=256645 RepID=A0A9P9DLL6_9PLEO|nr:Alpha/Beta hydrolase protein [Dendryphion nanum]
MALRTVILTAGLLVSSATAAFKTPEDLLAAPRRSTANVNPSGEWGLFSSTRYNWTTHKAKTTWHLLNIANGNVTDAPFDSSVSEVVWVGSTNTSILYVNGTNDKIPGGVTLYTADIGASSFSPTLVASLAAPFSGFKAVQTESGSINFIANTLSYWNNGSAYNEELATKPRSTGQFYDANYVRHFDVYLTQERYAVFGGVLESGNGSFSFNGNVTNLLWGINATVTRPESPYQPSGDLGDYDLSPDGQTVAFMTKAPQLPKANYTASYIYIVPHNGSQVAVPVNGPGTLAPESAQGASQGPRWSPDSKKLAYSQQDHIYYESDRFKIYVAHIDGLQSEVKAVAENWDSSPSSILWAPNNEDLYVASEVHASVQLFIVPSNASATFVPKNFTSPDTTVNDFAILPNGTALVSGAAGWTSRIFYTQAPGSSPKVLLTANEIDIELAGLHPNSTSNFWITNDDGDRIQTFVFRPTNFDPTKKYPHAFVIHGGPQVAQGNTWSTRWNLRLWAEQGFVVTTTQFTGTASYGQNFTDKIQANWGGTPYTDLIKVFDHITANISYIDTNNAIAAGASYGGFMTNWIQGHDFGRRFKALVSHDGKVNQIGSYGTDELWFIQQDQNGTIWDDRVNYEKYDPLTHARNFSTPQLVIHNDLDYRLPIAEGIMLFNVLQSRGVPSRFLHFPNEGHWVLNRENSLVWHRAVFNWIRFWTGLDKELSQDGVIHQ